MKKAVFLAVENLLQKLLKIRVIRQKMSKTKSVVDGLEKSCYNNFGSKTQVGASKSVKRLE